MSDSYVTSQAIMKCSCGTSHSVLCISPTRTVNLCGKPMANITDHQSIQNIKSFCLCRSHQNPAVSAAHGTPQPCIPNTPVNWEGGKYDYIIKGNPALLKSSVLRCMYGGFITIVDNGQSSISINERLKFANENERNDSLLEEDKETPEEEEEGWTWWDTAELIPIVGSLIGFGRSLAKGDILGAVLNVGFFALDIVGLFTAGTVTAGSTALRIGLKATAKGVTKKATKATVKSLSKNTAKQSSVDGLHKGERYLLGSKRADKRLVPKEKVDKIEKNAVMKNKEGKPINRKGEVVDNIEDAKWLNPSTADGYKKIELTEDTEFVRFFNPSKKGRAEGSWMMRWDDVKGLSPRQIKNKFALEFEPTHIAKVSVPKGAKMRKSIAGPIENWGEGGGLQYYLLNRVGKELPMGKIPAAGVEFGKAICIVGGKQVTYIRRSIVLATIKAAVKIINDKFNMDDTISSTAIREQYRKNNKDSNPT